MGDLMCFIKTLECTAQAAFTCGYATVSLGGEPPCDGVSRGDGWMSGCSSALHCVHWYQRALLYWLYGFLDRVSHPLQAEEIWSAEVPQGHAKIVPRWVNWMSFLE